MREEEAIYKLGKEAEKFVVSDLGKYLDGAAGQDIEAAKEEFLELNPYEFSSLVELQNKISDLQHRAKVAIAFRSYVTETIERGRQSEHQLETEE